MIAMTLAAASRAMQGVLHTPAGASVGRRRFRGVSTDTRQLQAGELFIALRGPRFDAHTLIDEAQRRGAVAAVVEREVASALPSIEVDHTRTALGRLAAVWREQHALSVIAVTGSNGKTTVKDMLAAIFGHAGPVLATRGNLNNDIGVPLTLFQLAPEHRCAVIEMGANHAGEIANLCRIARPTAALITVCAPAHLEGFGSVEGVARAKGEIISGTAADGVVVLNADDPYFPLWRELAQGRRLVRFGLQAPAEVTAVMRGEASSGIGSRFDLRLPGAAADVRLPLPGRHNVMNALAAAACAWALGQDVQAIRAGLENVRPAHGRLEIVPGLCGTVIDDSYNANPASLQAALEVLRLQPGEHWLVLGDMGELGAESETQHRTAGRMARASGVSRFYGIGPLTRLAVEEFGSGARHFENYTDLISALCAELPENMTVLVKGSRAMHMETIVRAIAAPGMASKA
ncbi:MAG TPA: UDP-N-acetylmuramoyl-tripeptide--D-alanyl-D-alanine ligase [Gammaproteobacteria bacterium]|nr:UDP-N-acetylmuramoyl-tripeptide--D-alanyl-D-alanine ligase [Gammaproteobacteria bacterium]